MGRAVEILQWAGGAAFVLLALLNARSWRRTGQARNLDLALALVSLGAVSFVDRYSAASGYRLHWPVDLVIVLLLSGAYRFVRFRAGFLPLSRRASRAVLGIVIAAGGIAIAARLPGGPNATFTPVQSAALVALLVVWSACMLEPAVRFWVSGQRLPSVQRSRLRALSIGYASVVAIIVLLTVYSPAGRHPGVTLAGYVAGLAMVPVIYAGFAPPAWLRRVWRRARRTRSSSPPAT